MSVIISVHNVEDYLDDCIDNMVKQTYKSLEIILVDDGSKGCSFEICQRALINALFKRFVQTSGHERICLGRKYTQSWE